jgi:hypothetical protein
MLWLCVAVKDKGVQKGHTTQCGVSALSDPRALLLTVTAREHQTVYLQYRFIHGEIL